MSWLADLAGKAEDFLNKVDQGAAQALTKQQAQKSSFSSYDTTNEVSQFNLHNYRTAAPDTQSSPRERPDFISAAAGNIKKSSATHLSSENSGSSASSLKPSSSFVRPKKAELNDDLLFDFLNSSDPLLGERKDVKQDVPKADEVIPAPATPNVPRVVPSASSSPPSTKGLSRTSSLSSISTSGHSVKTEDGSAKDPSQDTPESSDSGLAVPPHPVPQEPTLVEESQSQALSNLRLENQLLRNEVASLNQELATIIQRSKGTQEELNLARARTEKWNSDQSRTDRTIRELRSQVDDLSEALSAKDGQLAVLKVRLDEADQLLKSRSAALEEAKSEKYRILQDHTEGNNLNSQALQTLQDRLREADMGLKREQDSYQHMQSEFAARLAKVEGERQALAEALTGTDRRLAEERQRAEELQQQMKFARAAADSGKQELQDYKNKASRILQSKEKLISSLKEGSGLEVLDSGGAARIEMEELRHEKELQREEIQKLQGQVQSLRTEIQELEAAALTEAESWREQQRDLQEQQDQQSRGRQEAESEIERYKQELQYMEEEHHRAKSMLQSRIKDREEEIQKLRYQLTNKALSSTSQAELESRLHQLTETLIQKQTMLEALGTEKSSLVFQLERLEQQLKSVQGGQIDGPAINMSSLEGSGARQRGTQVFSDFDGHGTGVYSKVRKAANTIDRFSIRLGIFLRRYPMARVFVIVYMAILHLWVMIVLLTYSPEMHHGLPDGR
ncbi:golgin subfamily A member 5 isoform X2 [Denticeps clupeoides]|uniref:Golgin subfamily A member 5 n=1 Tax=Denticeps clupeoides TaxID=299321 RepID=A0AAY4DGC2_9TELE|nr:golgin subfamily A member 5 isoform X2 [Denticeps clupeoides]